MTVSSLSQLRVETRRESRRGAAILSGVLAIGGLAGCAGGNAGAVPADTDHGFLASSPAATAAGVAAAGPLASSDSAGTASPTAASSGDIDVAGKTNLGGRASAEFVSKIRKAVAEYVASNLPGTTVVDVLVTTEQPQSAPAVVTLAGVGGSRKVTMTLAEQSTGWVVISTLTLPGGTR